MATSCSFKKLSDIILIYFDVISAAVPSLFSRRLDDPSKPRTGWVNSVAVTGSHHAASLRHGIAWCNWRSLNFVDTAWHCQSVPEWNPNLTWFVMICEWADVEQLNNENQTVSDQPRFELRTIQIQTIPGLKSSLLVVLQLLLRILQPAMTCRDTLTQKISRTPIMQNDARWCKAKKKHCQ